MTPTDWEARYQTGDMPWEKGAGSPGLEEFLDQHPALGRDNEKVLVPGCGTGHDILTWARHGFKVAGLDLAPSAVTRSRERLQGAGLSADIRSGDFLRDEPWETFDWIFEHTLFCAIQPDDRDRYVTAVSRWLRPGGQFLAVHYMIDDRTGPPFGCTQEDLMRRFTPAFELRQGWVPRSYPNRTGLELMLWWHRRPA